MDELSSINCIMHIVVLRPINIWVSLSLHDTNIAAVLWHWSFTTTLQCYGTGRLPPHCSAMALVVYHHTAVLWNWSFTTTLQCYGTGRLPPHCSAMALVVYHHTAVLWNWSFTTTLQCYGTGRLPPHCIQWNWSFTTTLHSMASLDVPCNLQASMLLLSLLALIMGW